MLQSLTKKIIPTSGHVIHNVNNVIIQVKLLGPSFYFFLKLTLISELRKVTLELLTELTRMFCGNSFRYFFRHSIHFLYTDKYFPFTQLDDLKVVLVF